MKECEKCLPWDPCTCEPQPTDKQLFESAIKAYGIRKACAYFNHRTDGGFADSLVAQLEGKG